MKNKIKTYVIFVSRAYPAYHPRKGQPTNFVEKINSSILLNGLKKKLNATFITEPSDLKIHTFRGNFQLWEKRVNEVLAGNAVIVIKYHTLGRYVKGNKQIEFVKLDKDSGVGIQEAIYESNFEEPYNGMAIKCEDGIFRDFPFYKLAANDGLSNKDFADWFKKGKYNLKEPMACIHFTSFRYGRSLSTPK